MKILSRNNAEKMFNNNTSVYISLRPNEDEKNIGKLVVCIIV